MSDKTYRPLSDNVLVEREAPKEYHDDSPILQANPIKGRRHGRGIVQAIGPGLRLPSGALAAMRVRTGDAVYFSELAPVEVDKERRLCLVQEREIYGRFVDD